MTTLDTPKSKQRPTRQFSIDFVVPLQLEECIYLLEHYPKTKQLELRIDQQSENVLLNLFLTQPRDKGSRIAEAIEVHATLRRWEGISTRIQGEVESDNAVIAYGYLIGIVYPLICTASFIWALAHDEGQVCGWMILTITFCIACWVAIEQRLVYVHQSKVVNLLREMLEYE